MSSDAKVMAVNVLKDMTVDDPTIREGAAFIDHERDWEVVSVTVHIALAIAGTSPTSNLVISTPAGGVFIATTSGEPLEGLATGANKKWDQNHAGAKLKGTLLSAGTPICVQNIKGGTVTGGSYLVSILMAPLNDNPDEKTQNATE